MADSDDDVEPVNEAPESRKSTTSIDLIHGGYPMCVQLRHIGSSNTAQFCMLPRDYSLQSSKLLDVVKKTWGLTLPNIIITVDAGSAHPMQLATTKLASLPQFQEWLLDARRHRSAQERLASGAAAPAPATPARPPVQTSVIGGARNRMVSPTSPAPAQPPPPIEATEEDLGMINTLIFQKLITTMAAVLDAAALSNNWILIDRTSNRSAKSATAELLLELAMEQTDQRPTVLVIDTVERLEAFTGGTSRRQLDILQKLGKSAVPIGEAVDSGASVSMEWPYVPSDYLDPTKFYKKDLPRTPFPAHVGADGNVGDKRKWMYHYNQCLFGSGTHYIIMDNADDAFELDALGTVGNVVAHGGTLAYRRLRGHIQMGHPTVMLYNTGGATQAFGSLHNAITELQARSGEGRHEGRLPDAEELLPQIELTAREKWVNGFGLPEIMMMKELAERAPQLFRHTIVTCDLVNDSAEDVLETITSCFSSGTGGVPELGLGNAEANVVFVAWKRHLALFVNADRFVRWSHAVQYVIYALGLLTTVASVLYGVFETQNQDVKHNEVMATALQRAVIILPLLSALLSTIRARLKSRDKYAACLVASAEVAAEIYKYRLRTLEYDTQKLSMARLDDAGGDDAQKAGGIASKGAGVKGPEQRTRDVFVERVQNIYSIALGSELQSSGALRHDGVLAANIEAPRERAAFIARLKQHVSKNVYKQRREDRAAILEGSQAAPAAKGPRAKMGQVAPLPTVGKGAAATKGLRADGSSRSVDPDDFATPMSIESYVQFRVRPFVASLEKSAPRLARTLQLLEVLVFVSNSLGAVLAIIVVGDMSLANFVAVTVALSAIFSSMIEYHNLQLQVTASNGALRETHNLLVWWAGLSMVDRRTRFTKHHVCSTMERCLLSTIAAESAAVIQSGTSGDGADGMDGE